MTISNKTFNQYLYENEIQRGESIYLRQPIDGVWHELTWNETMRRARIMTTFLKSLGLKPGDRVAIFSKNCAEWFLSDFAIAIGGFVSVPLFNGQSAETNQYIVNHSEAKIVFVGKLDNQELAEKSLPKNTIRISFPYKTDVVVNHHWDDILKNFDPYLQNYIPDGEDLYSLVYTSGTTGSPKGAMISHRSIANAAQNLIDQPALPSSEHQYLMSYLPLAHITERIVIELASIVSDSTVSFAESIETFLRDLQCASPNLFLSVPRLWKQFQLGVFAKIPEKKLDLLLKIPLVNKVVKRRIKASLGLSRCRLAASGSAPLSPALHRWYRKIGLPLVEGYGRTEDLALNCASLDPDKHVIGTVGSFRKGVSYRIGENNELLTKSDFMMSGYYKDDAATKAAFTDDGFLHTGDEVSVDELGNVKILGRVSETFKTDKGEFIVPSAIEKEFTQNTYIEQLCLLGLGLRQPILIVVPTAQAKLLAPSELKESLLATLIRVNEALTKYEKVSHIIIAKEFWSPENGFLTPTLKVRRKVIHERFIETALRLSESVDPVHFEEVSR